MWSFLIGCLFPRRLKPAQSAVVKEARKEAAQAVSVAQAKVDHLRRQVVEQQKFPRLAQQ